MKGIIYDGSLDSTVVTFSNLVERDSQDFLPCL